MVLLVVDGVDADAVPRTIAAGGLTWCGLKLESGPITSLHGQGANSPEAIPLLPPGRRVGSWARVVCPRPGISGS